MGVPVMALVCRVCEWRPPEDLPMGVVAAHMDTEHDIVGDAVDLDLRAFCPTDDTYLGAPTKTAPIPGGALHTYDCPECHRTFRLRRQTEER